MNGIHHVDGLVRGMIPAGEKVDAGRVRLFTRRIAWEFTRCAILIPRIYSYCVNERGWRIIDGANICYAQHVAESDFSLINLQSAWPRFA